MQGSIGNQGGLRRLESGFAPASFQGLFQGPPVIGYHGVASRLPAKLRVNAPGDRYEQEADRVADQVMRMPQPDASAVPRLSDPVPRVQHKCSCGGTCADCKAKCVRRVCCGLLPEPVPWTPRRPWSKTFYVHEASRWTPRPALSSSRYSGMISARLACTATGMLTSLHEVSTLRPIRWETILSFGQANMLRKQSMVADCWRTSLFTSNSSVRHPTVLHRAFRKSARPKIWGYPPQ